MRSQKWDVSVPKIRPEIPLVSPSGMFICILIYFKGQKEAVPETHCLHAQLADKNEGHLMLIKPI